MIINASESSIAAGGIVRPLADLLLFVLGWQASIFGAAKGLPFLGPVAVVVLLVLHALTWDQTTRRLQIICLTAVIGTLVESTAIVSGLYTPAGSSSGSLLCPLWITGLWMLVGTVLPSLNQWLAGKLWLASLLGGTAAGMSYFLAVWLGAIRALQSPVVAIGCWTLSWAIILPILLVITDRRLSRKQKEPSS